MKKVRNAGIARNIPSILAERGLHAELAAQYLVENGFALQTCTIAEMPARLAGGEFNVVVFGRFYLPRKTRQEAELLTDELIAAVQQLLARGGGVFFASAVSEPTARRLMLAVGAQVLPLQVAQDDRCHVFGHQAVAAYSTEIGPHFAEGLSGFWYPVQSGQAAVSRPVAGIDGVVWEVVASASAQSRTMQLEQENYGLPGEKHEGFATRVPLLLCRDALPGRLALCGLHSGFHIHSPNNYPPARAMLCDGFAGVASDWRLLLTRLLRWLAEPSLAAGTLGGAATDPLVLQPQAPRYPDDPPLRWPQRGFWPDVPARRGLIGARTSHSGGTGSVAEYVAKARRAGHDFIVFLEHFPVLGRDAWQRLRGECAAASDDKFLAVPGYIVCDLVGSWSFQYGLNIDLPGDDLLVNDGACLGHRRGGTQRNDRLEHVHMSLTFGELGLRGRRGFFRHQASPKTILQNRFCDSIAVVTWEKGRLVDDIRGDFPMLLDKGLRLHPAALTLMDGPGEFDAALASGWCNTLLEPYAMMTDRVIPKHMAPELERWTMFDSSIYDSPRYRFDCWQYGMPFQCASGGPVVTSWTVSVSDRDPVWREPDCGIPPTADLFRNDVTALRLRLGVKSEKGLAWVCLRDGERILRRWLAHGATEFVREIDLQHHQQMHLFLEAADVEGGTVVTGDFLTYRRDWCEFYCADRNNPLAIGYEKDEAGYAYGWSGVGHLVYNDSMWGGKSPYIGKWWYFGDRIFPVALDPVRDETGPFDGGIGAGAAGLGIKIDLPPQDPPERSLMVNPRQELISADVAICDFICDHGYDPQAPYILVDNPGFGLYGMLPTRYLRLRRRATVFRPKPHALTTVIHRYELQWEQRPQVEHPLFAGWFTAAEPALLQMADGSTVDLNALRAGDEPVVWQRGCAVTVWKNGARPAIFFNESAVDLLLSRGHDDGRKETWRAADAICVALPVAAILPPGETQVIQFAAIGGTHAHKERDLASHVVRAMGMAGAPAYSVEMRRGAVASQRLELRLEAEENCGAAFRVPRCDLPMALPLTVGRLHRERTVVLYDRPARRWRPLGALDGVAYAVLDTAAAASDIFIGHPLRVSHPDVGLSMTQIADDSVVIELHNPGGRPVECRVTAMPEFDLIDWRDMTVTLPAGSSEVHAVKIRPGT